MKKFAKVLEGVFTNKSDVFAKKNRHKTLNFVDKAE